MPVYHKYIITYENPKVADDQEIIEVSEDTEYIRAFNGIPSPKMNISYREKKFTEIPMNGNILEDFDDDEDLSNYGIKGIENFFDSVNFERGECTNDIVHIVWKGEVQPGFIHGAPIEIPKDCFLILKFDCDALNTEMNYPESDSQESGISVPGLDNAKAFVSNVKPIETDAKIFLPLRVPEGTLGFFRRDLTYEEHEKFYELALKCWKISDTEGEAMMSDRIQMN